MFLKNSTFFFSSLKLEFYHHINDNFNWNSNVYPQWQNLQIKSYNLINNCKCKYFTPSGYIMQHRQKPNRINYPFLWLTKTIQKSDLNQAMVIWTKWHLGKDVLTWVHFHNDPKSCKDPRNNIDCVFPY